MRGQSIIYNFLNKKDTITVVQVTGVAHGHLIFKSFCFVIKHVVPLIYDLFISTER